MKVCQPTEGTEITTVPSLSGPWVFRVGLVSGLMSGSKMFHSNSRWEHMDRQTLLTQIPNTKMQFTQKAHEGIMIPQQQNSLFYRSIH